MEELLSSCVTSRNEATHVWKTPLTEKWFNVTSLCTAFWTFYCETVVENCTILDQGEELPAEGQLWFSEIPGASQLLTVDFKFSFPYKADRASDDLLPEEFRQEIINEIQSYVTKNFCEFVNGVETITVLSYSNPWSDIHQSSDGHEARVTSIWMRIQLPNLRVETKYIQQLQEELTMYLNDSGVFDTLENSLFPLYECLLKRRPDMPVLMFGSVSPTLKMPLSHYTISAASADNGKEIGGSWSPEEIFSAGFHAHSRNGYVDHHELEAHARDNDYQDFLLPYFLSIEYPLNHLAQRRNIVHEPIVETSKPDQMAVENETKLDRALRFIAMLSPKRFLLNETDWHNIGRALYRVSRGTEQGLLLWIKETKKVLDAHNNNGDGNQELPYFISDSVEITCHRHYDTFARDSITIRTLAWYASIDNKELYREWQRAWVSCAIEESFKYGGSQTDIAEAFYRRYWLNYAFDPNSLKGTWYRFKSNGHRWQEVVQGIKGLRDIISHEFVKNYEKYNETLTKQISQATTEEDKTKLEKKVKLTFAIIKNLKNSTFKSGIVRELSEKFARKKFSKVRDSNYFLTGVSNGILEVSNDRVLFRDGKPEDYITMSTRIPYREDFTFNTPLVQECMRWFEMVYVDKEVLEYFLKFGASGLIGRNLSKNFFVMAGEHGHNSKSMITRGFEEAWGDYMFKIPVDALSQKFSDPSKPNQFLARGHCTRFAFTEEPDRQVELSAGVIKRYTGNDAIYTRLLHQNGGEQIMTFKMAMASNNVPSIPNPDSAIRNRVAIIPHDSVWCRDAPPTFEEQMKLRRFPMDPNFEKKIPSLATAFLWIMVKYFPAYAKSFEQPAAVRERCEHFWLTTDVYAIYINERVKKATGAEISGSGTGVTLSSKDLYDDFKTWYRLNYPGSRTPDSGVAKGNFIKHLGRLVAGTNSTIGAGWIGHELIVEQDNGGGHVGATSHSNSMLTKPRAIPA